MKEKDIEQGGGEEEEQQLYQRRQQDVVLNNDIHDDEFIGSGYAIQVRNVYKSFRLYHEKKSTLYEHLIGILSKSRGYEKLDVLKDISFDVKKGEMIGVIAKNGQGKTTLLQILSGILKPDSGVVKLYGSTVPFLGLGTGFQPDLSAIDNIIMYGLYLGLTKKEIKQRIPDILAYSELERFADTKLKHFSTGMHARLAFATAVQVNPDILLVDEVLSVGDVSFQEKSFETFLSFKRGGKTIVFVTHTLELVKRLCDRAIFIQNGKIQKIGRPDIVVDEFYKFYELEDRSKKLS
jgi:ABC-type polysaccharide/polyol phosphate transport system ATPase subunit